MLLYITPHLFFFKHHSPILATPVILTKGDHIRASFQSTDSGRVPGSRAPIFGMPPPPGNIAPPLGNFASLFFSKNSRRSTRTASNV